MIYDKPITVLAMPDTQGIPTKGGLVKKFDSWCAEKTVYASRFWESVANGSRVDKLVELPLHRDVPAAGYARLGGHTYRVEQTQTGEDGDGLPVTWLSLDVYKRQVQERHPIRPSERCNQGLLQQADSGRYHGRR